MIMPRRGYSAQVIVLYFLLDITENPKVHNQLTKLGKRKALWPSLGSSQNPLIDSKIAAMTKVKGPST